MNRTGRQACALGALSGALGWLLWRGPLATAPDGPDGATRAVLEADAVVVRAFAVLRAGALAACVALGLLALVHAVAAWTGARPLQRLARWLTPHALRPFLGVVTVATLAAPVAAGASTPPTMVPVTTVTDPPPTMRRVTPPPATSTTSTTAITSTTATSTTATSTSTTVGGARPTVTIADVAVVSPVQPKARAAAPTEAAPAPATWTIRRGEHLWYVAAQVVSRALGHPAGEREIAPYWQALVAANRDRLVDPDNPDLVHAGLEVVLPDPPVRSP